MEVFKNKTEMVNSLSWNKFREFDDSDFSEFELEGILAWVNCALEYEEDRPYTDTILEEIMYAAFWTKLKTNSDEKRNRNLPG